jgi:hypothetical protein
VLLELGEAGDDLPIRVQHQRPTVEHEFVLAPNEVDVNDRRMCLPRSLAQHLGPLR